jgi:amicyanin
VPRPAAHRLADPRFVAAVVVTATLLSLAVLAVAPSPGRSATHTVEIADFAYAPSTLTIAVGDTVTWTNADLVEHTATSTTGAWDTGPIAQAASASITFTEPGTYDYLCSPHPTMTGRVVVSAPASGPAATPVPSGGALPDVAMATEDAPLVVMGSALLVLAATLLVARALRAVGGERSPG